MKRTRIRILTIITVVIAALAVLLYVFDWNRFKPLVESRATDMIGRQVSLQDLNVDLSLKPLIRINGLKVANPPWATQAKMLNVESIRARLDIPYLLAGNGVRIPELEIIKPTVNLERSPEGEANWDFDLPEEEGGDADGPVLEELVIREGQLHFQDVAEDIDLKAQFTSGLGDGDEDLPLSLIGDGTYKGTPLELDVRAGSLTGLQHKDKPFPVDIRLANGKNQIEVEGSILNPAEFSGLEIDISAKGENPAELYPLIPLPFPSLPPYELEANITRNDAMIEFKDLAGTIGDSDISGDVAIDLAGERPDIEATLASETLDFDDLSSLIGAPPATGGDETVSDKQAQQAEARQDKSTVLPDKPINLEKLDVANASVEYSAKRVKAKNIPLDDVQASIELKDGNLQIKPFKLGIGGGHAETSLELTGRGSGLKTTIRSSIDNVNLREILVHLDITNDAAGNIDGRIDLTGTGNSVAAFLGSSDGAIRLIMQGGRLSSFLVELVGLDVGEALLSWLTSSDAVTIRCALLDFHAEQGVLREKTILFDTTDTRIIGAGSVNLNNETLDLTLDPRAKDFSLLSAESRIELTGTFKNPEAGPSTKEALLGILTPIDFGEASNADCEALQKSVSEVVQ